MYGGPFEHTLSNAQVISDFINHITSKAIVEAMEYGDSVAHPLDDNTRSSVSPAPQAILHSVHKGTGKCWKKAADIPRTGKASGKQWAPDLVPIELEDDNYDIFAMNLFAFSEIKRTLKQKLIKVDPDNNIFNTDEDSFKPDVNRYVDVLLPSSHDVWEKQLKIAYKDRNSQVFLRMVKDIMILWLTLKISPNNNLMDNDTEGSIDGNIMDITQAINCMMLDKGSASGQLSHHMFILVAPFINMPKKDGGRGPIKWCSISDIDDFGFIDSPIGNHMSPISNAEVVQDYVPTVALNYNLVTLYAII
ncbi:hypothetical protein CY34DRAFT_107949 [Suillus luteus UH-Slu-Lm8-n1]|uniref:Uncharacterized protein n=1 Tax=Suillus luteus UH-Slu-Lm8-n1 TaxID=930992 RepID=A0A0C9ZQS3_9AGAM|nr:hypothetical protein CY34DRAFT_107949 [Suillus luteus UH-Slu-Lm8-n1]